MKETNHKYVNFSNVAQVVLWECELTGQISDGNWENARPHRHWEKICYAVGKVAKPGENLGCYNFSKMRRYNFADKDLLDVVGTRMRWYVVLAKLFPNKLQELIDNHHSSLEFEDGVQYIIDHQGDEYYKRKALLIQNFFEEKNLLKCWEMVHSKLDEYTSTQLRKDLKEMSHIVNNIPSKWTI